MKRNPLIIAIGALLVFIVVLLLFVFQVRTSEVVVLTRFGEPTRYVVDAGPHLKWPWPIQKVHRFDQREQNFEDKFTEPLTLDSFNLLASVYVGWKITDPEAFLLKFKQLMAWLEPFVPLRAPKMFHLRRDPFERGG